MFGTTLGASRAATPDLASYQKIGDYVERSFKYNLIYLANFKHGDTCS